MKIKTFQGGYDHNFSYVISSKGEAVVIDSFDAELVLDYLKEHNLELKYVISTHNHFDHIEGNQILLQKTKAKLMMHQMNDCDLKVKEGDEFTFGKSVLKILHTPGHTLDSICILLDNQFLFTGDTLFVGYVGRIFYEQGYRDQPQTLKRIQQMSGEIKIYPGHNYGEKETILIRELLRF